jgi:hypothetical protein
MNVYVDSGTIMKLILLNKLSFKDAENTFSWLLFGGIEPWIQCTILFLLGYTLVLIIQGPFPFPNCI